MSLHLQAFAFVAGTSSRCLDEHAVYIWPETEPKIDIKQQAMMIQMGVVARREESKHEVEPSTRVFGLKSAPPISLSLSSPNLSSSRAVNTYTFPHCTVLSFQALRRCLHRAWTRNRPQRWCNLPTSAPYSYADHPTHSHPTPTNNPMQAA